MKILYSHRTRSLDGQKVHIDALTGALRARGHEVRISAPRTNRGKQQYSNSGFSLREILPEALTEWAEYGYSHVSYRRLSKAAQQFGPDVLYERYNLFHHAGENLKAKVGLPFLLEINAPLALERAKYGGTTRSRFARRSEQRIWQAADAILPVSHALGELVKAEGVGAEKIHVIHNGVGPDFLRAHDARAIRKKYGLVGKTVLGFCGYMRDWHRVDRAIRFIASNHAPANAHLFIIGDGPSRRELEVLVQGLNVGKQVTFAGVIQQEDLAQYIATFDVALQPAATDYASPLKLFEYMALGKPVLAIDTPGVKEVLRDGLNGVLFHDDGAFSEKLALLCRDSEMRARLGVAARDTIEREDYTWNGNARKVELIAEQLLRNSNVHPYRD